MTPVLSPLKTRILAGFDDPTFGADQWENLLTRGDTNAVNLTWPFQRAWWHSFGRGQLLLTVAERDGRAVALAPLFADAGMIFSICPEDFLDFVGDIGDPAVLAAILETARDQVPGFLGFRFYFVSDSSRTGPRLREAAGRLGLDCFDEESLPVPALDLTMTEAAQAATRKKSLLRHENFFRREGAFDVLHLRDGDAILPHLEDFFEQHCCRRAATSHPSLFCDPATRSHYQRLTRDLAGTGWLRFTRLEWQGRAIAFHYGLCYRGRYLWGIPSFEIELARHSPGEVLLRQALLAAIEEGASTFDFGIGDESYKYRFATHVIHLRNWGLYPKGRS
jgi:CelD/BcsL family acetyltransferase involved in cellulose biosynthesis